MKNFISCIVEINEYKLLNIRSLDFMYAFMKLIILDYLGFHKYLEETGYDFFDLEFIDIYHELEVHTANKNYKKNVKQLKELKEIELLREQEINEIKNVTKIKINVLNYEINDILKDLDFELKYGILKNRYFKRQNTYEYEIKLRFAAKEKINKIERLKEEVRYDEDILLNTDTEISKFLIDLKYEEESLLYDIMTSESKLKKLGITYIQINKIKNSISSSYFMSL